MRLKDVCPCTHPSCTQCHCWVAKQLEKAGEMWMTRQGDTSSPSEAGLHCHCGCAPAPPNPPGAPSSREGSQVQGLFTGTNKSSDFRQPWEQQREDTCMSAGGLSCCSTALAAAAKGTSLPWLRVPPKYATSRWCLAPHPCFLTLSLPLSPLHRPSGC